MMLDRLMRCYHFGERDERWLEIDMINVYMYVYMCMLLLLKRLANIAVVTLHRRNIIQETRRLGESLPPGKE